MGGIDLDSNSVSFQKELHKEEEIANVHDQNTKVVFLVSPASFVPHHVKGCSTDKGPNDHLRYLSNGNPFGVEPFWLFANGHEEIVKVHDRVDAVVDARINQSGRTVRDKGEPSAQQNRHVVVPVEQH